MVTQNNPFVLPGFGQSGDMAQNPLMASMEMMRQAWQGMAGSSGLNQAAITPMSVEDLERRIGDLRAVENWLRMNLSMLSSTIQGLEVQRSTIATLKTFMSSAAATSTTPDGPSPLEVVLGMAPGHVAAGQPAAAPQQADTTENAAATAAAAEAYAANAATTAQGWWDMVQKQFDSLAVATAASLQGAEEAAKAAVQTGAGGGASADSTLGKAPAKAPRKAATKTAAKAVAKTAVKTAAPAKTPAKKAAAKKAAPRKQATLARKKP